MRRRALVAVATFTLAAAASIAPVQAAQPGLSISPAIEQVTFAPGQAEARFEVLLSNSSTSDATLATGVQDFAGTDAQGALQFLADGQRDAVHGLSGSMHTASALVIVPAGDSTHVTITVNNDPSLAPGGHYGGVIFRSVDPRPSGSNTVGLQPAVSVLVFTQTSGNGTQRLRAVPPLAGNVYGAFPTLLAVVLRNDGNTQSVPRGTIRIYGMSGALVAHGVLNVDSGLVLPGAQRLFETSLRTDAPLWPGVYRVAAVYRADGQTLQQTTESRFVYVSTWLSWGLAAITIALVALSYQLRRRRALVRSRRFWTGA